jgi:hypothetical protein
MKLHKNLLKGAVASLAVSALLGMGMVPAHAAAATTTFKIHLNVPKEVTEDWNLWYWNTGDANVGPVNNTIGESTVNGVTMDWTPNFDKEDAYGAYAEFTLPVALTALNNVMRTTESWDGFEAVQAVADDPATADVDETVLAKPAIPAADKPRGGDAIFPAGESWWNLGTGKQEFPLKDMVDYKVHVNMSLADAQKNGWNLWTWGPYTPAQAKLSAFKVITSVTKTVKGKKVTTKVTTYPYKGKVGADLTGVPFSGSDSYGSYAVIKLPRVYVSTLGFLVKRSAVGSDWNDNVKSTDFKSDNNNNVAAGSVESYVQVGGSELTTKAPTFVGRYGATATRSGDTITVTPVRPSHPSMKGAFPDKIVVTAKKGATVKTCTIQAKPNAVFADARWALASSCDITGVPTPAVGDGDATWEIFVQASSGKLVGPGATDKANAKVVIAEG